MIWSLQKVLTKFSVGSTKNVQNCSKKTKLHNPRKIFNKDSTVFRCGHCSGWWATVTPDNSGALLPYSQSVASLVTAGAGGVTATEHSTDSHPHRTFSILFHFWSQCWYLRLSKGITTTEHSTNSHCWMCSASILYRTHVHGLCWQHYHTTLALLYPNKMLPSDFYIVDYASLERFLPQSSSQTRLKHIARRKQTHLEHCRSAH